MGNFPLFNPFAAPAFSGMDPGTPPGFHDRDHVYVWPKTTLTQNQRLLNQFVQIDPDSDFIWRGFFYWTRSVDIVHFFVRFIDEIGEYINPTPILCVAVAGSIGESPRQRFPIFPAVHVPAGGLIRFDVFDDNSAAGPREVELMFQGSKRFRI